MSKVIDYYSVPFEWQVSNVDVVSDRVRGDTLKRSCRVLRDGGTLVSIMECSDQEDAHRYRARGMTFTVCPNRMEILQLLRLVDAGLLRPIIADILPHEEAHRACEDALHQRHRGRIVLSTRACKDAARWGGRGEQDVWYDE